MTVRIINGDCIDVMRTLPDESVHSCVTSPPYFGLRDYDVPPTEWPAMEVLLMPGLPPVSVPAMTCGHGLEPDPISFVAHEVMLFREVRRVLRDDGTTTTDTTIVALTIDINGVVHVVPDVIYANGYESGERL